MKLYTKTGDRGTTAMLSGNRIKKSDDRIELIGTIDELNLSQYDVCIVIRGMKVSEEEAAKVEKFIHENYSGIEVYVINGMQDIYDYILILE